MINVKEKTNVIVNFVRKMHREKWKLEEEIKYLKKENASLIEQLEAYELENRIRVAASQEDDDPIYDKISELFVKTIENRMNNQDRMLLAKFHQKRKELRNSARVLIKDIIEWRD